MKLSHSKLNINSTKNNPALDPVLVVFGPTAVGKTRLLLSELAGKAEVISADSMQVYRGLDIGTAKPTRQERAALPHHGIDIRNPDEHFDVGDFVALADERVAEIRSRGVQPVIAGGTAFYLQAYLYGLPETPGTDREVRVRLEERLRREGLEELRRELLQVDPESWGRIDVNDAYRTIRALEVYTVTGRPRSSFSEPDTLREGIDARVIGLHRDRQELYRRINERVEKMFADGLAEEVAGIIRSGYGKASPGLRAIGYREFAEYPSPPPWSEGDLQEIKRRVQRDTRRYAKRQITFFKRLPMVQWVHAEDREGFRRACFYQAGTN